LIYRGLGIGDWGLGIGDWGLGPIPNPQSPSPYFIIFNLNLCLYNLLITKLNKFLINYFIFIYTLFMI